MFKRILGVIVFVGVILIVVMAVHERREIPADRIKEEDREEAAEEYVVPVDSIRMTDTLSREVTSEDLIMDMVGVDTVQVAE